MYRVVLIDDERMIVEGLRKVIPWQEYRCEVAGTAEDAASGAALIREVHPHIVFTDIRMPGEDGLTMLAGLRSEFPDMQVSVLTGYRDFSYAQEAIRLGVTRFLLKPSKLDEIKEALSAMTDRLHASSSSDGGESGDSQQAGHYLVRRAIAYMEQHYAEKLTLFEVADACYVSQWHLSKLLNRETGKSFFELLGSMRVEKAKALLRTPGVQIQDVAEQTGYTDVAHFSKNFKKYTGMTPGEYRH